jgi:ParB family chromosome partitioning protein
MKIPIKDIIIKKRIRRDTGNIDSLVVSLQKHGLLHPVVLSPKKELIAGYRRLQAAQIAGWETIDAVIINKNTKLDQLEVEIEENLTRKDFTEDELYEALKKKEKLKKGSLWKRIVLFFKRLFKRR